MGKFNAVYTTVRWEITRAEVLKRDKYLCQWCLKKGIKKGAVEVHHKIHLTYKNYKDPKIAYGLDNLVSLCELCHKRHHNPNKYNSLKDVPFPIPVGDENEHN